MVLQTSLSLSRASFLCLLLSSIKTKGASKSNFITYSQPYPKNCIFLTFTKVLILHKIWTIISKKNVSVNKLAMQPTKPELLLVFITSLDKKHCYLNPHNGILLHLLHSCYQPFVWFPLQFTNVLLRGEEFEYFIIGDWSLCTLKKRWHIPFVDLLFFYSGDRSA